MESGKRSVLKRSRPTESPRKMSYLALDRGTAKPPFVGSNPTRASKLLVSNQWITAFVSFPESPICPDPLRVECRWSEQCLHHYTILLRLFAQSAQLFRGCLRSSNIKMKMNALKADRHVF